MNHAFVGQFPSDNRKTNMVIKNCDKQAYPYIAGDDIFHSYNLCVICHYDDCWYAGDVSTLWLRGEASAALAIWFALVKFIRIGRMVTKKQVRSSCCWLTFVWPRTSPPTLCSLQSYQYRRSCCHLSFTTSKEGMGLVIWIAVGTAIKNKRDFPEYELKLLWEYYDKLRSALHCSLESNCDDDVLSMAMDDDWLENKRRHPQSQSRSRSCFRWASCPSLEDI